MTVDPRRRGERIGKRPRGQAEHVDVVEEGPRRDRKTHPAEFSDLRLAGDERFRTQSTTNAFGLVHNRFETELHQLVRGDHPRHTRADHRHFRTERLAGYGAEAGRMAQPVVVGEREVGPEDRDRCVGSHDHDATALAGPRRLSPIGDGERRNILGGPGSYGTHEQIDRAQHPPPPSSPLSMRSSSATTCVSASPPATDDPRPMRAYVGVTDRDWYRRLLATGPHHDEVNFWFPSPKQGSRR